MHEQGEVPVAEQHNHVVDPEPLIPLRPVLIPGMVDFSASYAAYSENPVLLFTETVTAGGLSHTREKLILHKRNVEGHNIPLLESLFAAYNQHPGRCDVGKRTGDVWIVDGSPLQGEEPNFWKCTIRASPCGNSRSIDYVIAGSWHELIGHYGLAEGDILHFHEGVNGHIFVMTVERIDNQLV